MNESLGCFLKTVVLFCIWFRSLFFQSSRIVISKYFNLPRLFCVFELFVPSVDDDVRFFCYCTGISLNSMISSIENRMPSISDDQLWWKCP